jgi:ABC-type sugar transport system ATPase subunit
MNAIPQSAPAGTSSTATGPVLEARAVSKHFGPVVALSEVDFQVHAGEIVGLVGDNGAGKSTLIKVLSGSYGPDGGEVLLSGETVHFSGPRAAQLMGIETVYQDLALFDELSITANIFAGREKVGGLGFLKEGEMRTFTQSLIEQMGVRLPNLKTMVRNLSGGQRQAVALARSVAFGSKVVIFDEPTSALSKAAAEHVLDLIRDLRAKGIASIFIGHNLDHVIDVCDRIVVLRQGSIAGELQKSEFSIERIVSLMVGGK